MAVVLGSYAYGCGQLHQAPVVNIAPPRIRKVEVFDVHGVGEVVGGRSSRPIPVQCMYQAPTVGDLGALIGVDDNTKLTRNPQTLNVGGRTFSNCVCNGVEAAPHFYDGLSGYYVCHAVIHFESLTA